MAAPGESQHTANRVTAAALAAAVFTLGAWTSAPVLIKFFSRHIDAWTSNGWRYGFGALVWLPVLIWAAARGRVPRAIYRDALPPAIFNTLGQIVFAAAFYQIDTAMVTFGLRIHIVFVAIGAAFMFPAERALIRSPRFFIPALLVMAGAATVAVFHPEFGDPSKMRSFALGTTLSVLAGMGFAGYALSVRRCMHTYHPIISFAVISQYTAVAMIAVMLAVSPDHGASAMRLPIDLFLLLLLSALIAIALGHVTYFYSINRMGVTATSGVVQLQPFCVAIAAALLPALNEQMVIAQWIGGTVAVAAAIAMLLAQRSLARAPAKDGRDALAFDTLPVDADVAASTADPVQPEPAASR